MTKTEGLEALLYNLFYFAYQREGWRMDKPVYENLCGEENTKNKRLFDSQTSYKFLTVKACAEFQIAGSV